MSPQSSGLGLRSLSSSRPKPSSSTQQLDRDTKSAGAPGRFSGQLDQHEATEATEMSRSDDERDRVSEQQKNKESETKGGRSRVMKSFLLPNPLGTSHRSDYKKTSSSNSSARSNGKQKVDYGGLQVPKRGGGRTLSKASPGGSPLAAELAQDEKEQQDEKSLLSSRGKQRSLLSNGLDSSPSTDGGRRSQGESSRSQTLEEKALWRNSIGRDTDPAQIVNLALNLGESRRRQASGAMAFAHRDISGSKRMVSSGQRSFGSPYNAGGGSLRRALEQQRRTPSGSSPRSSNSIRDKEEKPNAIQSKSQSPPWPLPALDIEREVDTEILFMASDATLARAEKARTALELGFEHRRLLQYLPAIPQVDNKQFGGSRPKTASRFVHEESLGREYNPLQYIRNRKVRLREKKPLLSELDGWNDVAKVRAWVDVVKNEREIGISRVDDRFPLPPFDGVADQPVPIDTSRQAETSMNQDTSQVQKPRPRMDWIVSPWDLLADVHWLDQHHNFERIEDSSGRKIFAQHEDQKTTPVRRSKESTRGLEEHGLASQTLREGAYELPALEASNSQFKRSRRRRRPNSFVPRVPAGGDEFYHAQKRRWSRKLTRSRSSSSSNDSDWSRTSLQHRAYDNSENAVLEKHLMDTLAREAEIKALVKSDPPELNGSAHLEVAKPKSGRVEALSSPTRPPNLHRMRTEQPRRTRAAASPRASFEELRLGHRRMSSDELHTAPTSPVAPGLAPDIAVDTSPPENSPKSIMSPLKLPFTHRLGSFRRDRSRSIDRRAVSENDAVKDSGSSMPVTRQTTNESLSPSMVNSRDAHLDGGMVSPSRSELSLARFRTLDGRHNRNREILPPESRFRGMFKGGRIAELVGNEVSRVGDKIWKKESSSNLSHMVSPTSTDLTDDSADDSEFGESLLKADGTKNNSLSPVLTDTDSRGKEMSKSSANGRPKYHMNNLPSFRSPFANEDRQPRSVPTSTDDHHITRQQQESRERSRSSRFDRLAPPRIDLGSISTSTSRTPSASHSEERGRKDSRASSLNRSIEGVSKANGRLNDLLSVPQGRMGTKAGRPMTGLAAFASSAEEYQDHASPKKGKPWSISDHGLSTVQGVITKRDIARVRALLMSSGVKANEITRRYEEPPVEASSLLKSVQDLVHGPLPLIPPSQELVFAARTLIVDIEGANAQLRDVAERFSSETVDGLHDQIKALDDRVNAKLTPLVRAAADDADAFSTELTTTHTLAMKQLNDGIDGVLRKRRRRTRWLRKGGWAMVEWLLLGIMWMAWLIAVLVRVLRRTVGGIVTGTRWLLWL